MRGIALPCILPSTTFGHRTPCSMLQKGIIPHGQAAAAKLLDECYGELGGSRFVLVAQRWLAKPCGFGVVEQQLSCLLSGHTCQVV